MLTSSSVIRATVSLRAFSASTRLSMIPQTLFVGYQARGTLGRRILRGDAPVRILGHQREVSARIELLNGLSAYGDREDMLEWLGVLKGCSS